MIFLNTHRIFHIPSQHFIIAFIEKRYPELAVFHLAYSGAAWEIINQVITLFISKKTFCILAYVFNIRRNTVPIYESGTVAVMPCHIPVKQFAYQQRVITQIFFPAELTAFSAAKENLIAISA